MIAFSTWAQVPPDQKLSAEDERGFNEELERLQKLLSTANDKETIEMQIANTYAAGGQFSEAIRRLRKVVGADIGFDPSRAIDFRSLRATAEFESIMEDVRRQTPPVHNSRLIATLHTRRVASLHWHESWHSGVCFRHATVTMPGLRTQAGVHTLHPPHAEDQLV